MTSDHPLLSGLRTPRRITRERLERALIGMADLVERYPETLPLLERLEKDYALLRRPPESERIKKLIEEARKEDGLD